MKNIKKAVLFDLDNTLYDYDICHEKGLFESYNVIKNDFNLSFHDFCKLYDNVRSETHKELDGYSSSHNRIIYFQKLIFSLKSDFDSKKILNLYESYYEGFFKNMKLFDSVEDLFIKLNQNNIKIGVVTNLNSLIQFKKVDHLDISKYIDNIVTSEESSREKPHSSIFLLALNKLNVRPKDVIMVGDSIEHDIIGSNSLKIDSILFDKNSDLNLEDYSDDKIIKEKCIKFNNFKDISKYLTNELNL